MWLCTSWYQMCVCPEMSWPHTAGILKNTNARLVLRSDLKPEGSKGGYRSILVTISTEDTQCCLGEETMV